MLLYIVCVGCVAKYAHEGMGVGYCFEICSFIIPEGPDFTPRQGWLRQLGVNTDFEMFNERKLVYLYK